MGKKTVDKKAKVRGVRRAGARTSTNNDKDYLPRFDINSNGSNSSKPTTTQVPSSDPYPNGTPWSKSKPVSPIARRVTKRQRAASPQSGAQYLSNNSAYSHSPMVDNVSNSTSAHSHDQRSKPGRDGQHQNRGPVFVTQQHTEDDGEPQRGDTDPLLRPTHSLRNSGRYQQTQRQIDAVRPNAGDIANEQQRNLLNNSRLSEVLQQVQQALKATSLQDHSQKVPATPTRNRTRRRVSLPAIAQKKRDNELEVERTPARARKQRPVVARNDRVVLPADEGSEYVRLLSEGLNPLLRHDANDAVGKCQAGLSYWRECERLALRARVTDMESIAQGGKKWSKVDVMYDHLAALFANLSESMLDWICDELVHLRDAHLTELQVQLTVFRRTRATNKRYVRFQNPMETFVTDSATFAKCLKGKSRICMSEQLRSEMKGNIHTSNSGWSKFMELIEAGIRQRSAVRLAPWCTNYFMDDGIKRVKGGHVVGVFMSYTDCNNWYGANQKALLEAHPILKKWTLPLMTIDSRYAAPHLVDNNVPQYMLPNRTEIFAYHSLSEHKCILTTQKEYNHHILNRSKTWLTDIYYEIFSFDPTCTSTKIFPNGYKHTLASIDEHAGKLHTKGENERMQELRKLDCVIAKTGSTLTLVSVPDGEKGVFEKGTEVIEVTQREPAITSVSPFGKHRHAYAMGLGKEWRSEMALHKSDGSLGGGILFYEDFLTSQSEYAAEYTRIQALIKGKDGDRKTCILAGIGHLLYDTVNKCRDAKGWDYSATYVQQPMTSQSLVNSYVEISNDMMDL